ncbi:MAG: DUF4147 domain-containing protein [Fidelibacterota bacterium]
MFSPEKKFLKDVYLQSLNAVQPSVLFGKYLHRFENNLYYHNTLVPVSSDGKTVLAGSGKASVNMAKALLSYLSVKPDNTLLVSPFPNTGKEFRVLSGDHPLPGRNSCRTGKAMAELMKDLKPGDLVYYVLSGGSSSLLEYPAEGISAGDIQKANKVFLTNGLTIYETNFLRTRLSRIKGGGLAEYCRATVCVFVLSDVMGNDMSVIGSGPFYSPATQNYDIDTLIRQYRLEESLAPHVIKKLRENTPAAKKEKKDIPHFLVGSNIDLLGSAAAILEKKGINVITFPESLYGEARDTGKMIASMIRHFRGPRPSCLLFGGETTVTLSGKTGKGGRSQETALSALLELNKENNYVLLCAGSDGIDGNSDAAGAVVNEHTQKKAKDTGLSLSEFMERHDSYSFHQQCGSLIKTGYTGTNVNDIAMALLF